jgi:hypothetical protein
MACDHDMTELVLGLHGETPPEAAPGLQARLSECADCRRELEELRQGASVLAALPLPEASPETLQGLEAVLRRPRRALRLARRAPAWLMPLALAAALLTGAAIGLAPLLLGRGPAHAPTAPASTPSIGPAELLAWMSAMDRQLEDIARQVEAVRTSVRRPPAARDPGLAESLPRRGQDLDRRLQALQLQISRLAEAHVWDTRRAEL